MDLVRLGTALRAVRMRHGWRQATLAHRARVSASTVSRIERGHATALSLDALARVAEALGVRLDLVPRWRGADLDRMLAAGHSAMHDHVAGLLTARGWLVASEATFSVYGERGSVDVLAFHPGTRALLVVELKTELVDVQALLSAVDRYRRLAPRIASERGWRPISVSVWVALRETRSNRRRLAAHRVVLRAAYPVDGRTLGAWLAAPRGAVSGMSFLPDSHRGTVRPAMTGAKRVRPRPASVAGPQHPA